MRHAARAGSSCPAAFVGVCWSGALAGPAAVLTMEDESPAFFFFFFCAEACDEKKRSENVARIARIVRGFDLILRLRARIDKLLRIKFDDGIQWRQLEIL